MAHIGGVYPVAFRRDFNLNLLSNSFGWPRWYRLTFRFLPPGTANTVNNFTFLCGPETYPDKNSINWESPLYTIPIFAYKVKIIVQINNGKQFFKGGELIQKNAGTILAWHWQDANDYRYPNFDTFTDVKADFYNTDWFDDPPDHVKAFTFPFTWAEGATR